MKMPRRRRDERPQRRDADQERATRPHERPPCLRAFVRVSQRFLPMSDWAGLVFIGLRVLDQDVAGGDGVVGHVADGGRERNLAQHPRLVGATTDRSLLATGSAQRRSARAPYSVDRTMSTKIIDGSMNHHSAIE